MASAESFEQYRIAILNDIARINDSLLKLQDIVMQLAINVENLRTTDRIRSAIWGSTGGAAIVGAIMLLMKGIKF